MIKFNNYGKTDHNAKKLLLLFKAITLDHYLE